VPRTSLALVLHNHQPVGNFGWVIEEVYNKAYEPLVAALERHPRVRLGLHYTGPLLDWLAAERPDFLGRLRSLVAADRIELLGGGYYEPVLASLPDADRLSQLRMMADAVERIGGRRPTGAWLAERVWEPDLPVALVDGGYRWTILDDAHFRAAAIDDAKLFGHYTTDDQGRLLTLFGSDKELRYRIPFGEVDDTITYLRGIAGEDGHALATMGDDGEKFGSWPETYPHCWGHDGKSGWVDRFFDALEANREWLSLVTPSEWLAREAPLGRVYVPTSSYAEMGGWALPADEANAFEHALADAEAAGRPEARWLRGGFWRNFQVKYREINELHKQMLRASAKVAALPAGAAHDRALGELLQGQSNDCYWHGVFGGIYIAHMRLATLEHLIAAEDLADTVARVAAAEPGPGGSVDRIATADTDLDGVDDLLVNSPGQVVVIAPAEGAGIGSWDIRAVRHALTAVMRRRREAYHQALIDHDAAETAAAEAAAATEAKAAAKAERAKATAESGGPSAADEHGDSDADEDGPIPTIHGVVRVRESGLAARLRYDTYERRSGLVHLFASGTDRETYAGAAATELGDAHDGAYELVEQTEDQVVLRRDVTIHDAAAPQRRSHGEPTIVRIDKRFTFDGARRTPGIRLEVTIEHRSGPALHADLAVEWALMMLGGGGNPAAYYEIGGDAFTHDSAGQRDGVERIESGSRYIGVELSTTISPAATAWWSPIETVSNSEFGFERVYQGSALVTLWPLRIDPGERRTVTIDQRVTTTRDRADGV
jgi:4-alpha-glucanotransferase